LLVTAVLLAFSIAVSCSNGTTDDKTPQGNERTTVFTDKTQNVEITISNRDISARAREALVWNGDNYVLKHNGNAISSGTVEYTNANNMGLWFNPAGEGSRFYGTLNGGVLTIAELVQGGVTLKNLVLNQAGGSGVNGPASPTGPRQPVAGIGYDVSRSSEAATTTQLRFDFNDNINDFGLNASDIEFLNEDVATRGTISGTSSTTVRYLNITVKKEGELRLRITKNGIDPGEHAVYVYLPKTEIRLPTTFILGASSGIVNYEAYNLKLNSGNFDVYFTSSNTNVFTVPSVDSDTNASTPNGAVTLTPGASTGTATLTATGIGADGNQVKAEATVRRVAGLTGVRFEIKNQSTLANATYYDSDKANDVWANARIVVHADQFDSNGVEVSFFDSNLTVTPAFANIFGPGTTGTRVLVQFAGTGVLAGGAASMEIAVTKDFPRSFGVGLRKDYEFKFYQGFDDIDGGITNWNSLEMTIQWANERRVFNGRAGGREIVTLNSTSGLPMTSTTVSGNVTTEPADLTDTDFDYAEAGAKTVTWKLTEYGDMAATYDLNIFRVDSVRINANGPEVDRTNVFAASKDPATLNGSGSGTGLNASDTKAWLVGIYVTASYDNSSDESKVIDYANFEGTWGDGATGIEFTVKNVTNDGSTFAAGDTASIEVELFGKESNAAIVTIP